MCLTQSSLKNLLASSPFESNELVQFAFRGLQQIERVLADAALLRIELNLLIVVLLQTIVHQLHLLCIRVRLAVTQSPAYR